MNNKLKKLIDDIRYSPWRFWSHTWFTRHLPKHMWWHLTKGFCYCETWSAYTSIAKYALPRLKYLKDHTHGTPTQMFELPTHEQLAIKAYEIYLKRIENGEDGTPEDDWKSAEMHFFSTYNKAQSDAASKKWAETLDEMAYALEWCINEDWDKEGIRTGETEPIDPNDELDKMCYQYGEEKPVYDWNRMKEVQERVNNGLLLFGKFFQNLWD